MGKDFKIRLYSSETNKETKKLHFSDVNKYLTYDCLIYTPTLSAGISYEIEHYDYLFGYFVS